MYKRVLAAVNEFVNSEVAARYAIALARASGAKLYLVFAAGKRTEKEKLRHAESALERLFVEAEKRNVEVESIIDSGEPVSAICGFAREHDIDMVFTATRREDVQNRFFIRTHSRALMLRLRCSVAMVRVVRMGGIHLKNILVPLRGVISGYDERARFIAMLAEGTGAGVTICHTRTAMTGFFRKRARLGPPEREGRIPRDIEQFAERLREYGIPVIEKKIVYGSISRSISMEAAFRKNDLIVMGASEKSLLASLADNPVEQVLRETPCNMIIFRGRKPAAAECRR